jgi:cadmium resistance protein CadD (predicted permease)
LPATLIGPIFRSMEIIFTSLVAFAGSNLDDIFILALLFGSRQFAYREIIAGQFLGISALITVSWLGSFVGLLIAPEWIGMLGLIPIYLGIKGIVRWTKHDHPADHDDGSPRTTRFPVLSVASVTIANGGDNISLYLPLFATLTRVRQITMILIFLIMTAVWCALAKYVTDHPIVKKGIDRYGHAVTPFVLILLGAYILYKSGTFHLMDSRPFR